MINPITQDISLVTALPGLLAENRPTAVNQLVEEELPQLSIELENLTGQLNAFAEETNQAGEDIEANKTATQEAAIIANGLANYQGAWNSTTTYLKGQSVSSGTLYYISKVDSNLNHIITDTNYWLPNPINDKINKNLSSETNKATPVDADLIPLSDSAASFGLKKLSWANLKATLISSFGALINGLTAKTTPVDADMIVIGDSASSNASKKLTFTDLKTFLFGSPALTGTPTAPTQTAGDNSTKLATTAYVDGKMSLATAVTASGTAIDFAGIPSWAKRVTIVLDGISTNNLPNFLIQLGDSGGIENSGYTSSASTVYSSVSTLTSTIGFNLIGYLTASTSAASYSGLVTIDKLDQNIWCCSHTTAGNVAATNYGGGRKQLSSTLDRIRVTTASGTDTFDAGQINIMYEG